MSDADALSPDDEDLLPSWMGPLQRAIARTDRRLDALDMDRVRRARSIDDCAEAELDHLAAERSVDVWDPAWPIEIRRSVVRAAPLVHATKGTPHAIELALSALNVAVEMTEWWETSPRGTPYTFEILGLVGSRLYADGPALDARTLLAIYTSVMRTKAHARAFELRVGVRFGGGLGLAPVATAVNRTAFAAAAELPVPDAVAGLGLAPVATAITRTEFAADAELPVPDAVTGLGFAPVAAAIALVSFDAQAQ